MDLNINNTFNNSSEIKNFSKTNNQKKNSSNDKINEVNEKIFKQRLAIFSEENDNSETVDILNQTITKISKYMHPISEEKDSPFSDTDLIVFEDDYKGTLPRTGIKKSELTLITQMYNEILDNKNEIFIDNRNPQFKQEIMLCIKTLLTRDIGRKLIKKLVSFHQEIKIKPGDNCCTEQNVIEMNLEMESKIIVVETTGKFEIGKKPPFLTLGHEMVHICHFFEKYNYIEKLPPLGKEYSNLEEQVTITGLKKGLFINKINTKDDNDWEPIVAEGYDELNERNLTEAFTGSLTEFFNEKEQQRSPRIGHEVFSQYNVWFKEENYLKELEDIFKKRLFSKDELNDFAKERNMPDSGSLYLMAIRRGYLDILKTLLIIDPTPQTPQDNSLLLEALKSAQVYDYESLQSVIDTIFEASNETHFLSRELNSTDKDGNTPLHYLAALGYGTLLKKLMEKGAKYSGNHMGMNPVDYAISQVELPLLYKTWENTQVRIQAKKSYDSVYKLMKELCTPEELLDKLQNHPFFMKDFIFFGDQNSILECLDFLHQNNCVLPSILSLAVVSFKPAVIQKLKEWNYNLSLPNAEGKLPFENLMNRFYPLYKNLREKGSSLNFLSDAPIRNLVNCTYKTLKAMELPIKNPFFVPFLTYGDSKDVLEMLKVLRSGECKIGEDALPFHAVLSLKPEIINTLKEWEYDFNVLNDFDETPAEKLLSKTKENLQTLKNSMTTFQTHEEEIKQWMDTVIECLQSIDEKKENYKESLFIECLKVNNHSFAFHTQKLLEISEKEMLTYYLKSINQCFNIEIEKLFELNNSSIDMNWKDEAGNNYLHILVDALNSIPKMEFSPSMGKRNAQVSLINAIKKIIKLTPALLNQTNLKGLQPKDLVTDLTIKSILTV